MNYMWEPKEQAFNWWAESLWAYSNQAVIETFGEGE